LTKKHSFTFIKEQFEKHKYTLLENTYINAHTKLHYICPKGHKHLIAWNHWREGHRCPHCAGQGKLRVEDIRQSFEAEGYTLITEEYTNSLQKLKYICPKGHKCSVIWHNWKLNNTRCSICATKKRAEFHRKSFDDIKKSFLCEKYELITNTYTNSAQKLIYICPNSHKHEISWHDWNSGVRCPKCFDGSSKWEKIVRQFIDEVDIRYIPNDRTVLRNPSTGTALELDIWIPDLNKAIECNGIYWHSFDNRKNIDKIKKQLCQELNIGLLVITDNEWVLDEEMCKLKILNFIK